MMTDRSDRGSHKPRGAERFERHDVIRDAIRGMHQGQQPRGAARTGRTHGCTRPVLIAQKILLAPQGSFSNRASLVNFFFVAFRVMVLFAVGSCRRSIWSGRKARALQGPQRADVSSRAHGPNRAVARTSPEATRTSGSRRMIWYLRGEVGWLPAERLT